MTNFLPRLTLVLGGAASGKSAYAETLINRSKRHKLYVATAQAFDVEMKDKIQAHQNSRGDDWQTIEAPFDLTKALKQGRQDDAILIDCATLWLTNLIMNDAAIDEEITQFLSGCADAQCPVVVVSNELGQGVVPENALARRFRNAHGRMNQNIAAQADTVVAVMAGLPLALKGTLL